MCRRAQGAGFVTWVGVDRDRFEFVGSTQTVRRYASSADAERTFCGRCGTPLLFQSTHWADETHVTLATLDPATAATLQPQMHAYWSSRAPWVPEPDDGLPRRDPPDHA